VTYSDVGGCKEQIEKLREVVETPLLHVRVCSFLPFFKGSLLRVPLVQVLQRAQSPFLTQKIIYQFLLMLKNQHYQIPIQPA